MATRPNVTVTVVDSSFVVTGSEAGSPHISGMYSSSSPNLVTLFGVTTDVNRGYMTLTSVNEWISKLNGTTFGGTTGQGPTAGWKTEWYSAYNYLLYGGALVITNTSTGLYDTSIVLDTVFTASLTDSQAQFVTNTVSQRDDIVGIIGVTYEGYASGTVASGVTASLPTAESSSDSRIFLVGGEKSTIGLSNTSIGENFVTVPLAVDAAGCFARTDREVNRWFSPAGTARGRILNSVRLLKNPNNTEQDNLYTSKINSVIGIPGEGVFLFGDITKQSGTTSTLSRVNVVRLINYIKRILGRTAKDLLFEVNDTQTRNSFALAADGFLRNIQSNRGLYDYKVVCDESNNPASIIDSNQFVADIYIKPTKSINYIKLVITNLNTDAVL